MSLDQIVLLVLRAFHILSGVAWAGAVFLVASVVLRGKGAREIMDKMAADGGLRRYLSHAAGLTVLSGIGLMWWLYGFRPPDPMGAALGFGAIAALVAAFIPFFIERLPADDAGAARAARLWRLTAALLGFAALMMAIARYL